MNENFDKLKTVEDLLNWGADQFEQAGLTFGHGTDNAWDEALLLVLYSLDYDFDHIESDQDKFFHQVLSEEEKRKILNFFEKRIEKKTPAAYLTHRAYFAGFEFYVDERVLIPRSPIAELIEERFTPWVNPEQVHHVLDLCTGSGCIAIASALYFPEASIDAVDISKDALAVAKINCERHHVSARVNVIESDLFNKLKNRCYDLIISNPPYVGKAQIEQLPQEYHHEPYVGFHGGESGLDLVDTILSQSAAHLAEKGVLIVEVGYNMDAVMVKYPKVPFLWLDFERGGEGVFMLTKEQLIEHFGVPKH